MKRLAFLLLSIVSVLSVDAQKKKTADTKPLAPSVYDVSLLKNLTDWEPKHSLKEGFEKTYNIMKKNIENNHE
jgi:nucleoside-diphosphate-sugar epimerase